MTVIDFERRPAQLSKLLLAVAVVVGAGGSPALVSAPPLHPSPVPAAPAAAIASPYLVVDPSSWWMVAGNTTRFFATWDGVPAGCTSSPAWYRWSLATGWVEGLLAPSDGPVANFTAASVATGTAEVEVSGATVLECDGTGSAVHRTGTANVTVVVPPRLLGLVAAPDPITAGNETNLTGSLTGGEPPYRMTISWGDGSDSRLNLSTPGGFVVSHRFSAGTFTPAVEAEDAAGLGTHASVEEPVYASGGPAVGVEASRPVAEVGVPVEFTGAIVQPPSAFSYLESCSDSSSADSGSGPGPNVSFNCTFAGPGVADVSYEVVPSGDDLPAMQADLLLPVEAPLDLVANLSGIPGEVGQPSLAFVELTGGLPPFTLDWQLSGNSSQQETTIPEGGAVVVPVWPTEPGTFGLTIRAVDAVGAEDEETSLRLSVEPDLEASATVGSTVGPGGSLVRVSGSVPQGNAPFSWVVVAGQSPSNETPPNGTMASVSGFEWTGTLPFEGTSTVTIGVVDAAGVEWWMTVPVGLVPPLTLASDLRATAGNQSAVLALNLTARGGLPPYSFWANWSDGHTANGSLPAAGTYPIRSTVNESGPVGVTVVVIDRLGVRAGINATANVTLLPPSTSPPPSPPPPSPPPPPPPNGTSPPTAAAPGANDSVGSTGTVLGATAVLLGLAALAAFLWRRRAKARRPAAPLPEPTEVLREILQPADGAERSTVELLAEERGVPLAVVRSTLDRLIAEGTVRAETGSDGEEVLAWMPPVVP